MDANMLMGFVIGFCVGIVGAVYFTARWQAYKEY